MGDAMLSLPIFYFPSAITCIDDNHVMLSSLKGLLENDYMVMGMDNPREALTFFKYYQSRLSKTKFLNCLNEYECDNPLNRVPVYLEMGKIMEIANFSQRYEEVSVIIVDYLMPQIDGITLCRSLSRIPCKKILLTAHADHEKTLAAFNEGIIDRFIVKDGENTISELVNAVQILTQKYFIELTTKLRNHLEVNCYLPVNDDVFINFFTNLVEKYKIKEYYLIDKNGSFLLINSDNKISYLAVHTDASLNYFTDLYDDEDSVKSYLTAINTRQFIPFFLPGINPDHILASQWQDYLFKPEVLNGRNNRYYLHIVELNNFYASV